MRRGVLAQALELVDRVLELGAMWVHERGDESAGNLVDEDEVGSQSLDAFGRDVRDLQRVPTCGGIAVPGHSARGELGAEDVLLPAQQLRAVEAVAVGQDVALPRGP